MTISRETLIREHGIYYYFSLLKGLDAVYLLKRKCKLHVQIICLLKNYKELEKKFGKKSLPIKAGKHWG